MGKKYTLEYEHSPLGGILDRQLFLATDEWKNKLATIKDVEIIVASSSGTEPIGTTTLQIAYNNSTSPQIITNAVNGPLVLKNGSYLNTDTVLSIRNKSGSPVFSVTGEGTITGILARQEATTAADRHVWFSDSTNPGKLVYDNDFKYNPSTNLLTVGSISGSAAKLTTARQLKVALGSTTPATFDGSENQLSIPVSGSLPWSFINDTPTTVDGYGINDIPASVAVVVDLLTNINGRPLTNYELDPTHLLETYPYFLIRPTSGAMDLIKAQTYLKSILGTAYIPTFNYAFPKNSYLIDSNGVIWKPQYNSDPVPELRMYRMPETYVTLGGDQVISGAKTFTQDVTIGSAAVNWTLDAAEETVFNIQASDGSTYYLPNGTLDTRRIATWEDVSQLASIGAEIIDLTGVV